jgi:hypothetical protein
MSITFYPQRIESYAGAITAQGAGAVAVGLFAGMPVMTVGGAAVTALGVAGLVVPWLAERRYEPVLEGEIVQEQRPQLSDVRAHAPHIKVLPQGT